MAKKSGSLFFLFVDVFLSGLASFYLCFPQLWCDDSWRSLNVWHVMRFALKLYFQLQLRLHEVDKEGQHG